MADRLNRLLESVYGVTYAGTYARCLDAGMDRADAESAIRSLILDLENERTLCKESARVERILAATTSTR